MRKPGKVDLRKIIYTAIVALIGLIIVLYSYFDREKIKDASAEFEANNAGQKEKIMVYVSGEVANPGIYYIEEDSRAVDAVDLAGGFTENADTTKVNLAKQIYDGDQINIPPQKTTSSTKSSKSAKSSSGSSKSSAQTTAKNEQKNVPVNLNCGNKAEYMKVSGVTSEIADAIVSHISEFGAFDSVTDLKYVEGISESVYNKISSGFTVE